MNLLCIRDWVFTVIVSNEALYYTKKLLKLDPFFHQSLMHSCLAVRALTQTEFSEERSTHALK